MAIFLIFLLILSILLVILSFYILIVLFYTRVPFVRTPKKVINQVLNEINIKPSDTIYDLGCGDGAFMIATEKKTGVPVIGYEISPWAFIQGKFRLFINKSKSQILFKNFYKEDLSKANIVFCFLIDTVMPKVGQQLKKQLKPGAIVISFAFRIPGWEPKKIILPFPEKKNSSKIYIYQLN